MIFKNAKYNYIWEKGSNVLLGGLFAWFAYVFVIDFIETRRLSGLIMMLYETALVFYLFIRVMPSAVSTSFYDWFIALAGTYMTLLLRPTEIVNELAILQILQLCGLVISFVGLLSLNKSFGLVAANRGIKTGGIYKYVRHPLYCGYVISLLGFVLQNPSLYNLCVYVLVILFMVLRIISEEAFLSQDQAYKEYKKQTKWRLLPLIW